jgi:hypothetical protein
MFSVGSVAAAAVVMKPGAATSTDLRARMKLPRSTEHPQVHHHFSFPDKIANALETELKNDIDTAPSNLAFDADLRARDLLLRLGPES